MTTFKAGDKVKVVNYPEHTRNGYEATITRNDPSQNISLDGPVFSYFITFDDQGVMWMQTRYLELVTAAPQQDEYADMSADEQVAVLTEELYDMSHRYQMDKKYIKNLQHDLYHYDEVMRETKEEQGWCDDGSNQVIHALNDGFLAHFIEPYQMEFEVEYRIVASVETQGTVMIMASSQEAAEEFFGDDPDSYITPETLAKEAVTFGDWENIEVEVI
jgi:hypothetical protein